MIGFRALAGGPLGSGPVIPIGGGGTSAGAQFRLLMDHFLANAGGGVVYPGGSIITVGVDVPVNWIPTQAVDPLNDLAILAYWNNGPINMAGAEQGRDQHPWGPQGGRFINTPVPAPKVFWTRTTGGNYILTGGGASLGPKAPT